MTPRRSTHGALVLAGLILAAGLGTTAGAVGGRAAQDPQQPQGSFRFRSAVDLVNVTVTVVDDTGRVVTGLGRDDFIVSEDGRPQEIAFFTNERVPVSLGIAIDTSGSMEGEKMSSARSALDRFLFELLAPEDEVFLYRITDRPDLMESWSTNRRRISQALRRIMPDGGTALYDTVEDAARLAQTGTHRKKALVIISDGNDTSSNSTPERVRRVVRNTEVLVYAVGIDGVAQTTTWRSPSPRRLPPGRWPPILGPGPGAYPPGYPQPMPPQQPQWPGQPRRGAGRDERVNEAALRGITDDSGGRTEIVRRVDDLEPATASIAAELSQQYAIGYASSAPRDGRWHDIDVRVKNAPHYRVRHRTGYAAK
jgi:Ca-activated chloride channel family protein